MNRTIRLALLFALAVSISCGYARTSAWAETPTAGASSSPVVLYTQPPSSSGGLFQSSRNGSDYDRYVWDGFVIQTSQVFTITAVQWLGGYDPSKFGSGGPVLDFTVAIYPSIAGGSQPDVTHPPLVQYQTGGNAGQTPAGIYGGIATYAYSFTLPAPLQASRGTTYWVLIEASQGGIPDWGITPGTGGDGQHLQGYAVAGDIAYRFILGDGAFTLLGSPAWAYGYYCPLMLK